jgi:hypothetical protein
MPDRTADPDDNPFRAGFARSVARSVREGWRNAASWLQGNGHGREPRLPPAKRKNPEPH